jgi:hypothetical protein
MAKEFQKDDFLEIDQSETKLPVVAIFAIQSGRNEQSS